MAKELSYEEQVLAWLGQPIHERDLELGAKLMLQGNRNRILHQNVIKKQLFDKIEYELNKIIYKQEVPVLPKIKNLEAKLEKAVATATASAKGKREDHEELPDKVKAIYETNSAIYAKMRGLHERLKVLSGESFTDVDRLPFIAELLQLDETLAANWALYDSYVIGSEPAPKEVKPLDVKRTQSNRTYLSRAGKKATISADELAEVQLRYDELINDGQNVAKELTDKLCAFGLTPHNAE